MANGIEWTAAEVNRNILYRFFNAEGELLYVGATTSPGKRLSQHHYTQPWWDEVDYAAFQRFPTHAELMDAECEAIHNESPRYNIVYSRDRLITVRKPRRQVGKGSIFRRAADGHWVGQVSYVDGSGKRRRKSVSNRDRNKVLQRLADLTAELEARKPKPREWPELAAPKRDAGPVSREEWKRRVLLRDPNRKFSDD